MIDCENLCKREESFCEFCQDTYDVSKGFYIAERKATTCKVLGYLVRDKKSGGIEGILTKATSFHELASIKPETLELYTGGENVLENTLVAEISEYDRGFQDGYARAIIDYTGIEIK